MNFPKKIALFLVITSAILATLSLAGLYVSATQGISPLMSVLTVVALKYSITVLGVGLGGFFIMILSSDDMVMAAALLLLALYFAGTVGLLLATVSPITLQTNSGVDIFTELPSIVFYGTLAFAAMFVVSRDKVADYIGLS